MSGYLATEALIRAANVCAGLSEGDDEIALTATMARVHLMKLVSISSASLIARLQTLNSEGNNNG